jgi:hypothetical protein
MSILVVQVLSQGIIFGADRNITTEYANGTTRQKERRPKVLMWPTDKFLFGFVGVATLGDLPMDEWLETLKRELEVFDSLENIAQEVHKRVQEQRVKDEGDKSAEGLIIHIGGFEKKDDLWLPFVWHIGNVYKLGRYGYLPDVRKSFYCKEVFWDQIKKFAGGEIDPLEVRKFLKVKARQFDPFWFHQGFDLFTFNVLESAIKSSFSLLCQHHPDHEIPTTLEGWAKHVRMQVLMYGAYFEAFHSEGERYVGGGADVVHTPWPD